jgi:hypothetical protein
VTLTAYGDGTGTFHPDELRIERGAALRGRGTIRADACVIGSGAGGAVVAKELAWPRGWPPISLAGGLATKRGGRLPD